jgi:hypothetical protein
VALWDDFGFNDSATKTTQTYATYKNALYILASKIMGYQYNTTQYKELLSCQLTNGVDAGGFATDYAGNGTPVSGSNTETTTLAILALSTPSTPEFSWQTIQISLSAILICATLMALFIKRHQRQSI